MRDVTGCSRVKYSREPINVTFLLSSLRRETLHQFCHVSDKGAEWMPSARTKKTAQNRRNVSDISVIFECPWNSIDFAGFNGTTISLGFARKHKMHFRRMKRRVVNSRNWKCASFTEWANFYEVNLDKFETRVCNLEYQDYVPSIVEVRLTRRCLTPSNLGLRKTRYPFQRVDVVSHYLARLMSFVRMCEFLTTIVSTSSKRDVMSSITISRKATMCLFGSEKTSIVIAYVISNASRSSLRANCLQRPSYLYRVHVDSCMCGDAFSRSCYRLYHSDRMRTSRNKEENSVDAPSFLRHPRVLPLRTERKRWLVHFNLCLATSKGFFSCLNKFIEFFCCINETSFCPDEQFVCPYLNEDLVGSIIFVFQWTHAHTYITALTNW